MKFADIIAPISEKEFFTNYFQKKHLLVRGNPDKFENIFSWAIFNDILSKTQNWNDGTLKLTIAEQNIPREQYCRFDSDRNHRPTWVPLAERVMEHVGRGASLVCNEVDSLHPSLAGVGDELEAVFQARVQSNVYCSRRARQAFKAHYDTHEVFVFHAEGQKKWHIYKGRPENPINNDAFKNLSFAERQKMAGPVIDEFTLNKGDFLYIPRGVFHDALADDDYSLHITFGANMNLGVDLLTHFFEYMMVHNPNFRASIPLNPKDDRAFVDILRGESDKFWQSHIPLDMLKQMRATRGFKRAPINLPMNIDDVVYKLTVENLQIQMVNGVRSLANGGRAIPIPPQYNDAMEFLLRHKQCTRKGLMKYLSAESAEQFIADCQAMKIL